MTGRPQQPPPHGTDRRYQWHLRYQQEPCKRCRAAHAAMMREILERNPAARQAHKDSYTARRRALSRLARLHPADYLRLLAEERGWMAVESELE